MISKLLIIGFLSPPLVKLSRVYTTVPPSKFSLTKLIISLCEACYKIMILICN